MNPSEDQTEDKIQKSKEKQKQLRNPKDNEKEGNPPNDPPKSKKELAAERRKKQVGKKSIWYRDILFLSVILLLLYDIFKIRNLYVTTILRQG